MTLLVKVLENFQTSVRRCYFTGYFNFWDRASRSEFWYFQVAMSGGLIALMAFDAGPLLFGTFLYLSVIPSLAVLTRRMHDINKGSEWIWMAFFTNPGTYSFLWGGGGPNIPSPILLLLYYWATKPSVPTNEDETL